MAIESSEIRISVVVPGFNTSKTVERCIIALVEALGEDDQLIYVDDGSRDSSPDIVSAIGDPRLVVFRSPVNIGRGPIRNRGVDLADGDVILFVDSDVVVHQETIDQIRQVFEDPGMQAMFGSYDDHPGSKGVVGKYRNLLHHFTHQTAGETASHFWTGLGAIRRSVFLEVGGYDEDRWSRNMEEVEFGHRLTAAGHIIRVFPEIQGRHLKPFSVRSMVRTDLFSRAIPWTRLMLSDRRIDNFVFSPAHTLSALGVAVMILSLLVSVIEARLAFALAIAGGLLFLGVNWRLWEFLIKRRGLRFTVKGVVLHVLHTLSAILGFAIGTVLHLFDSLKRVVKRADTDSTLDVDNDSSVGDRDGSTTLSHG